MAVPEPRLPTHPAAPSAAWPIQAADLRGLSRLGVDAVVGVTGVVEALHHTILSGPQPLGAAPAGRPAGITGLVYQAVRGATRGIGKGLDVLLSAVPAHTGASAPQREAWLAALNGVWGDHLEATANPLAIRMSLRIAGQPWQDRLQRPTGKLLVLVHGLAMNDLQWQREGHDHGQALAHDLGYTAVYLHYNTGRHVAQNGQDCSAQLDALVAQWPVPVEELVIVAHSMGGLVTRSACHAASTGGGAAWMQHLRKIVFLGTPHHGAPLERGGRLVDALFGISPYGAPFARLTQARSAGITDLRYGNVQAADGQHRARHAQKRDDRLPTPLPAGVACHVVAATMAEQADRAGGLHGRLVGDGLVPLASALGEHRNPALALHLPRGQRMVVTSAHHWDLLNRADICQQLRRWLA